MGEAHLGLGLRFNAAYWPAILLSSGEPLPTDILVMSPHHRSGKISKSLRTTVDPKLLSDRYGSDACPDDQKRRYCS